MQGIETRPLLAPAGDIGAGGKINRQPHGPSFDLTAQTQPEVAFREVLQQDPGETDTEYADRLADVLTGINAGHRDIQIAPDFGIRVTKTEENQPLPFTLLPAVHDASGNFANLRKLERQYQMAKDRFGDWLKRLARRFPTFRGGTFPYANTSATIIVENVPSVPQEKAEDFIKTAGAEFPAVANVHVLVDFTVPSANADEVVGKFHKVIEGMTGDPEAGGAFVKKHIEVINWGKVGEILRRIPALAKFIRVERNLKISAMSLQNTPQENVAVPEIDPDTLPFIKSPAVKAD